MFAIAALGITEEYGQKWQYDSSERNLGSEKDL